jgi:hypothetical protein
MRKVLFKQWIARVLASGKYVEGTGCWEEDFINEGLFHQWAVKYDEFESGPGNYTVALVEISDGTIVEVLPFNLKFV